MKKIILGLVSAPLFISCATVSKQDCLQKDWQAAGVVDGSSGRARADMTKVADSCSRFDMANPPANQYLTGYQIGLKQYCISERGFSEGSKGVSYPQVCSNADKEFPELVSGWKKGISGYCSYNQGKASAEEGDLQNQYCDESLHPAYFKGFAAGATQYCSNTLTAFKRGKGGGTAYSYCPKNLSSAFERAYEKGARLYQEISDVRNQLQALDNKISDLKRQEAEIERNIAYYQRRVVELEREIEVREDTTQRLEAALRKCAREPGLCDVSYVDSVERQLREASDSRSAFRRKKGEFTLALPSLFSARTRILIELSNISNQRPALMQKLSDLEAKEYRP